MPRTRDVRVNFIEYWEMGEHKVQHFSWVTDLRVSQRNVYHLMRGGRARWKIENETFNTLKNQGYHFEHNYGHGTQNLSVVFAMVMMLAFLVDQTQQLCCALFQAVWAKLGSKRLLWERMRAFFYDYALSLCGNCSKPCFTAWRSPAPLCVEFLLSSLSRPSAPTFYRHQSPIIVGNLCRNHEMSRFAARTPVLSEREVSAKARNR